MSAPRNWASLGAIVPLYPRTNLRSQRVFIAIVVVALIIDTSLMTGESADSMVLMRKCIVSDRNSSRSKHTSIP